MRRLLEPLGNSGRQDAQHLAEGEDATRSSAAQEDFEARAAYRKAKRKTENGKKGQVSCGGTGGQGEIKWRQSQDGEALSLLLLR